MATPSLSALSAYRQVLRATRLAFRGTLHQPFYYYPLTADANNHKTTDDFNVLVAARAEARKQFDQHKRTGVDTPMQIQHALEAASILRHNIVQGARDAEDQEGKWGEFFYFYFVKGYLISDGL